MIVSHSLATRFWPGKDPIGQHARRGSTTGPEVTVIGVVDDATYSILGDVSEQRIYLPLRQRHRGWETLIVHTRGEPTAALPAIRGVISSVDPTLPTFGVMTMEQGVASGMATSRTAALVSGLFGALALLIASVGLYAVVAHGVTERTREIGVRLALGSTPSGVLRFVMRGGARLGAWGLGIGLLASFGVARAMAGLLIGLSAGDPVTFALVPLILALVILIATWLPARRAVKLDPVAALRSE
jgi:putative ABC transport system permease protein